MAENEFNELVHIIDKDGGFIPVNELNSHFTRWKFMQKEFNYYVVAILGAQSSGKSTLLNLLFGTSFMTLDASGGRKQVTQGIWLGLSKFQSEKEEAILVFDVEGVDGRERGEKEASFERKTSLFSLALSEVLIVNMWHTDVGRYNAGNIALLKTVFEQHLQLFGKATTNKTLIMFLIRDHLAQETPLSRMRDIIMADMNGIWEGLTKPADFGNSKVSDFFDFMFTSLPHKILAEQEFKNGIESLRKRFTDPKSTDFVLSPKFKKDIPADGFSPYADKIWQTIKENRDLDLPSQKEMLAMFRCDEIMELTMKDFNQNIAPIRSQLDKGYVEDFGRKITELYNNCLAAYDAPASRYHQEVATRKRGQLESTMSTELFNLFSKQLQRLTEKTNAFFEKLVKEGIPSDGTACKDFAALATSIETSTTQFYEKRASESLLVGSNWSFQTEFEELKTSLSKQIAVLQEKELQKLLEEMRGQLNTSLSKPLDKILESPPSDMWEKVRVLYVSVKQKISDAMQERIKGFQISTDEATTRLEELQSVAFEVLKDRFKNKIKYINFILSKKFEELFTLDEHGVPRRWKPTDDVKQVFMTAKEQALSILETLSFLRLDPAQDKIKFLEDDSAVDDKLVIISIEEAQQIKDKFEKESNSAYLQALRDQEHVAGAAQVPMYIIVLVIVLGFNEFIWILSNPILLLFFVFMGAGVYVLYMLNMMGPAKRVMETLLHTSMATMQTYVTEQMQKANTANAVGVSSAPSQQNQDGTTSKKPKDE